MRTLSVGPHTPGRGMLEFATRDEAEEGLIKILFRRLVGSYLKTLFAAQAEGRREGNALFPVSLLVFFQLEGKKIRRHCADQKFKKKKDRKKTFRLPHGSPFTVK